MNPNCKNCKSYSKKQCYRYKVEIKDPDNTTCIQFIESDKKAFHRGYIYGAVAFLIGALCIYTFIF